MTVARFDIKADDALPIVADRSLVAPQLARIRHVRVRHVLSDRIGDS